MFKLNNKNTNLATATKGLEGALAQGLQDLRGNSPREGEKKCTKGFKKN